MYGAVRIGVSEQASIYTWRCKSQALRVDLQLGNTLPKRKGAKALEGLDEFQREWKLSYEILVWSVSV
jgi:hypothetical protein